MNRIYGFMVWRILRFVVLATILIFSACQSDADSEKQVKKSEAPASIQMKLLPAERTGILFNNTIKENQRLHYFVWNFIYQGAGVAIGDINNDGLPDIYFSGNMVSDKLYLNKGDFQFEDISKSSGIEDKLWSTGVNMVDVNADGLLDIYVCKNFFLLQEGVRKNKLFINQGDQTFKESAASYGLDDAGFSVQSCFFDADNDGDLDMYLVNQPMDQYSAALSKPETIAKMPFSDKFYRNDQGKFVDATEKMGMSNKSYGLNALATDFTGDGRQDIYVCNDYNKGDQFWINEGNGVFRDEISTRMDHTSFYSMGSDAADINNDGWLDLITLDMAFSSHYRSKTNMESMRPELFWQLVSEGEHYQYAVNNLHLNMGEGYFSEIAHLAGVSNSDWSWGPLFEDLDNDGNKDLVITNGLLKDLRNNDFMNSLKEKKNIDYDENFQPVNPPIPSTPVNNLIYQNLGKLQFSDVSIGAGFDSPGFSSGMASGDLDGDGDIDLVINNSNGLASVFENISRNHNDYVRVKLKGKYHNPEGIGAVVKLFHNQGQVQAVAVPSNRGYMSSSERIVHFGLGQKVQIDSLVVYWDHISRTVVKDVKRNQVNLVDYETTRMGDSPLKANAIKNISRLPFYQHEENSYDDYASQVLLPHKESQNGPFMTIGDINSDGTDEIFVGAAAGQKAQLMQLNREGKYMLLDQDVFSQDAKYEDLGATFFDFNGDNHLDLYVVSGSGQHEQDAALHEDRIYINSGSGQFTKYTGDMKMTRIDGQTVLAEDFDGDGQQDIFIGSRITTGKYPIPGDSKLLMNNSGQLTDRTENLAPEMKMLGLVTDATACDIENDGDMDLIIVGEWMPITLFVNENGKFKKQEVDIFGHSSRSWWWTINSGDFDKDGDIDFLIGNLGYNNKFKASAKSPFLIYSGDLDANGDHDVYMAKSSGTEILPLRGKECSTEEMPFISEKFKSFDAFARASLSDIIDPEQLKSSLHYSIHSFGSIYLENKGDLSFNAQLLDISCQMGPIKDFIVFDYDHDSNLDFIYGGNHYPVEVETVRYDGQKGGICLGNGKGGFTKLPLHQYPVYLAGDIRDLELLVTKDKRTLLATANKDSIIAISIHP